MTISNDNDRADFTGSGITGPYAFSFRILSTDQLQVLKTLIADPYTQTELVLDTDYSVEILGPASGEVTLTTALSSDYTLSIIRRVEYTQESNFRTQGQQDASAWENAFDYSRMVDIQLKRVTDGSIKLPDSEDPADHELTLPVADSRANSYLIFDSDGNVTTTTTGTTISPSPWIDVRTYGAVGDGVTNDTVAIQAAIDAAIAAGSSVRFYAKTYLVSQVVVDDSVTNPLVLDGGGAALKGLSSGTYDAVLKIKNSTNVSVKDLYVSGNNNSNYTAGIWVYTDDGSGVSLSTFTNVLVGRVRQAWIFGHDTYPDALVSEISVNGGSTYGCPSVVKVIGTNTFVSFNGYDIVSDYGGWPNTSLASCCVEAKGGVCQVVGGEVLMTTTTNHKAFWVTAIEGASTNVFGNIWVSTAAIETASPLAALENEYAVTAPTGGRLSISQCSGFHSQDLADFIEADADYAGQIHVTNCNFFSSATRTFDNISAANSSCTITVDDVSFGTGFLRGLAGVSGGIARTIGYESIASLTEFNGRLQVDNANTISLQPYMGSTIGVNEERVSITGGYSRIATDHMISNTGANTGVAPSVSTLYYAYVSNSQASFAPNQLRLSATSPSLLNGVKYLGTTGNAKNWRFVGWVYAYNNTGSVNFKDSTTDRGIANYYNRLRKPIGFICPGYSNGNNLTLTDRVEAAAGNWAKSNGGTGTTATYVANGEDAIDIAFQATVRETAGQTCGIGVAIDGTDPVVASFFGALVNDFEQVHGAKTVVSAEGYHTLDMVDACDSAGTLRIWWDFLRLGATADPMISGYSATVMV